MVDFCRASGLVGLSLYGYLINIPLDAFYEWATSDKSVTSNIKLGLVCSEHQSPYFFTSQVVTKKPTTAIVRMMRRLRGSILGNYHSLPTSIIDPEFMICSVIAKWYVACIYGGYASRSTSTGTNEEETTGVGSSCCCRIHIYVSI